MKVLFVFSTGRLVGSAPAVWMNLLGGLPSRGVEPFVVMPHAPDAGLLSGLGARSVPWRHIRFSPWFTSDAKPASLPDRLKRRQARMANARAEYAIGRLIDEWGIELLYICDGTVTAGLEAARKRGVPVVWHIHEFIRNQSGDPDSIDPEMHVGNTLMKADEIITVTKSIRTDLVQRFPGLRDFGVQAIYNGVLKSRVCDKKGILERDDRTVFTIAGYINENRGQAEALRAFSQVAPDSPSMRLRIVGPGSERDVACLRTLAQRAGVEDHVEYKPEIKDVAAIWEDTDVALNCSYTEGCSMALCEAMSSGCLALCSTAESNVELVDGKYGLLYQRRRVAALAHKMRWVLAHRADAGKIARAGKERAAQIFDLDRQLDAIYGVMESALQKHAR